MISLTDDEQTNVRKALRFLRYRAGGWKPMAEALGFKRKTLKNVSERQNDASPNLTFRVARLAGVTVDDVLAGRFPPPGACPHCGRGA